MGKRSQKSPDIKARLLPACHCEYAIPRQNVHPNRSLDAIQVEIGRTIEWICLGDFGGMGHPNLGASWEGFALEQALILLDTRDARFRATHAGAEIDLLVFRGGKRYGFEFKFTGAPAPARSMRAALEDLRLDKLWVIHPGTKSWTIVEKIAVFPLREIEDVAKPLNRQEE